MPFFSVIIPTYNRGKLIYPTLDSVLNQTEKDFELVVIDDGSTDSTSEALGQYASRMSDPRLRVIRRPNGGTTAARNTGIDAATGTYVALLDHDDLWFPWTLQIQRQAIEQSGGPAFCAGQVILLDSSQAKDRDVPCPGLRMRRYSDFLAAPAEDCPYYPSGWVINATFLRSVGGFFPYNRGYEDLDLLLRLGTASGYVRIWQPALSVRGLHEANLSSDKHLAWFVDGLKVLLEREHGGEYPGNASRAPQRRDLMCFATRAMSVRCLRAGRPRAAWWIYRKTFWWNIRLGRIRYLAGFPALIAMGLLRRAMSAK